MNWQQVVTNFDGEPTEETVLMRRGDGRTIVVPKTQKVDGKETAVLLTLGRACINALITELEGEQLTQTGAQRFDRTAIAMKIHEDKPLSVEDMALVKERVGRQYRADVVYNIWNMLETGK